MYVICTIYHHPLIIVSSNYDILKYNHNSILFSITPLPSFGEKWAYRLFQIIKLVTF